MSEKSYIPSGVFLRCDKGVIPTPLTATSALMSEVLGSSVATSKDKVLYANIKPFGVCMTTRMLCVFVPSPLGWNPVQSDVVVEFASPLREDSKIMCTTGGGCVSIFMSLSAAMLGIATDLNDGLNAAVDGAIKTVSDAVTQQFDKADDYLKHLGPPLADLAREELGKAEGALEGVGGIVTGLWELSKWGREMQLKATNTVVHAIDHPAEAAEAMKASAAKGWTAVKDGDNWLSAADMASNVLPGVVAAKTAVWLSNDANRAKAWDVTKKAYAQANAYMADPRNRGRVKGRAAFEIALAFGTMGAGEVANVGKAGELLNAGEKLAEGANAASHTLPMGKVLTGADDAAEAARAARAAEEGLAAERAAARTGETVEGAAKDARGCVGDPVDVATGAMIFDAVDIELPGPVPFVWERTWYSNSDRQGPLGRGWHHRYDLALWTDAAGNWFMRLADGRLGAFGPLNEANQYEAFLRAEQLTLRPDPAATPCSATASSSPTTLALPSRQPGVPPAVLANWPRSPPRPISRCG